MSRAVFVPGEGRLILAATPIGDAEDASPALAAVLRDADVIAAEDTRRLYILLARLGITTGASVVSFFEGNESERTPGLVAAMQEGRSVVVATDAGMPSVSDPGYRLVTAAIRAGIRVSTVPGPSAVLTALAVSGLPVDRFCFEGFLPRKRGERSRRLAELATEARTMVFFEAPHRLAAFLADAQEALGAQRPAVVCRELTKTHEEIIRGTLSELVRWASGEVRGEITVVIAGAPVQVDDWPGALAQVRRGVDEGGRLSEVVTQVAATTGLRRKDLYNKALQERKRP